MSTGTKPIAKAASQDSKGDPAPSPGDLVGPVKSAGLGDAPGRRMPSKRKQGPASSDDGSPASANNARTISGAAPKRQRVSRACDQCRAAREKCDGIQPLCFPCVSQNRACTWAQAPKKRGVQTGYIRALEVALGWLFDKVPGSEDALNKLLAHEGGQAKALLVADAPGPGSRLHKRWLKSPVFVELDRILSGGEPTRGGPAGPEDSDIETDADLQPGDTGKTAAAVRPDNAAQERETCRDDQEPAPKRQPAETPRLRLPPNHWHLLDIYFSYTHCWFPIIEKQDILKTSYAYSESGLEMPLGDTSSAIHAELWAVLALVACQHASSLADQSSAAVEPAIDAAEAYQTARRLIPLENGPFHVCHVRALLLLGLVNLGSDNVVAAWVLIGHAVRVALSLGLGQSENHAALPQSHRRAFLGCFILDSLAAARTGWKQHLRTESLIGLSPPVDEIDEWQPWQPCQGLGPGAAGQCHGPPLPAQALSSFRLMSDLCQALVAQGHAAGNGPPPIIGDSAYQYGNFVLTGAQPPSQVPSPYVLRLLYLVVQAKYHRLLQTSQTPLLFLREALSLVEKYTTQHGMSVANPLFTTCLALVRQCCTGALSSTLNAQDAARLASLEAPLKKIWRHANPWLQPNLGFTEEVAIAERKPRLPTQGEAQAPGEVTPIQDAPSFYAAPSSMSSFVSASSRLYPSQSSGGPNQIFARQGAAMHQGPPTRGLAAPTAQSAIMPDGGHMGMYGGIGSVPALASPMVALQHSTGNDVPGQHHHRGASSYDYETLLDDLASSIDFTDRVDADSQFMANLGFAPGADIADLLRGEFGHV